MTTVKTAALPTTSVRVSPMFTSKSEFFLNSITSYLLTHTHTHAHVCTSLYGR